MPFCFVASQNSVGPPVLSAPLVLDTIGPPASHDSMKSRLADAARRSLHEDVKRMTAEQRLAAFLAHCQLMARLANAGNSGQHPHRNAVIGATPAVHGVVRAS